MKKDQMRGRIREKTFDKNWRGKSLSSSLKIWLTISCSGKQGASSTNYEAVFHDNYRKIAEQYDRDFLKKHREELKTTQFFVRST